MNKKNISIVVLVFVGALVISAFGWIGGKSNVHLQRGRSADAARYTAMGVHFAAWDAANLSHRNTVDTTDYYFRHPELSMLGYYAQQVQTILHYGPPGR